MCLLMVVCGCGVDPCATGNRASLEVRFVGLPAGTSGSVTLTGPSSQEVTGSQMLRELPSGRYTVKANRVTVADPRIRTVYQPSVASEVCPGNAAVLEVTWSPVATSNKLWVLTSNGSVGSPAAFKSSDLSMTGAPTATVGGDSGAGRDVAFDVDGNLWTLNSTVADADLQVYAAASLVGSARKTPARTFSFSGNGSCIPLSTAMAFDPNGNLFISSCGKVLKFSAASLAASSGALVASATLTGFNHPTGLAFDKAGNLYVADDAAQRILKFAPDATTPSLTLAVKAFENPADTSVHAPDKLAFARDGSLWVSEFAGNIVFKVPVTDLARTGSATVPPAVRIHLSVGALLESLAFDEEGGLWTNGAVGKFSRFSPSQLTTSTMSAGAPRAPEVSITPAGNFAYSEQMAIYPAPAWSPLYAAVP